MVSRWSPIGAADVVLAAIAGPPGKPSMRFVIDDPVRFYAAVTVEAKL
jgi:hypothetical protein